MVKFQTLYSSIFIIFWWKVVQQHRITLDKSNRLPLFINSKFVKFLKITDFKDQKPVNPSPSVFKISDFKDFCKFSMLVRSGGPNNFFNLIPCRWAIFYPKMTEIEGYDVWKIILLFCFIAWGAGKLKKEMMKDISKPNFGYELRTGTAVFVLRTIKDKNKWLQKERKNCYP